jgi:ureidoacrylate peracid hydrolase
MNNTESSDKDFLLPRRSALLFFDMLNGHIKNGDPATQARLSPVIVAARELLDAARAHRVMVAYATANHRADNATTAHTIRDTDGRLNPIPLGEPPSFRPVVAGGTWESAVIDELAPCADDYLIPKYRWSAFFQTYLELALRTRKIDTLIIAGGSTDVGVASTAFAARDLDYHLVVVSDACTSPEQDNHDQFMRRIFPRMARVRTAAQVAAMLRAGEGAKGPAR